MRKLHPAVFLVRSLSCAANLTGVYRMRGDNQSFLNVQAAASSGPVCVLNTSLILELKALLLAST